MEEEFLTEKNIVAGWTYFKRDSLSFKHRTQATVKLKDFICQEITTIPEAMTNQALQNFRVRFQEYIACEGNGCYNL